MGKCFECEGVSRQYHHVVPRIYGGAKTVPLCDDCHAKVHDRKRMNISHLTKQALKAKRARGERTGGSVPFGYTVNTQGNTQVLIPNPPEQKTIEEIMDMRQDQVSFRKIVSVLNEKHAHGKKWHLATIQSIVRCHGRFTIECA
jgi:hypothetical protein